MGPAFACSGPGDYNGVGMAKRIRIEPVERLQEFLQECLDLRRSIREGTKPSEADVRFIKANLEALLADLDMSVEREERPH